MKVADLFAKLGLRPDSASFSVGDKLIGGIVKGVRGLGTSIQFALGAAFTEIASQIKDGFTEAKDFETQIKRLQIAASGALPDIRDDILEVSDATGVMKEDLREGVAQFVSLTGNTKAAGSALSTFAKVSKGTGADMLDVAGAAAAMSTNLGITAEDFEQGFSILIAQGKAGAVELKDLSKELAKAAPLAGEFSGGKGLGGLAKLGAAFQLVRRGTGSAAEATTRLVALQGAIISKAGDLEKIKGIKVFNVDAETGVKTLRAFDDIVKDIANSELAKDPEKLIAALGAKEAFLAFIQLKKVDEEWLSLANSNLKAQDVAEDYAEFQTNSAAIIDKAWNKIRNSIFKVTAVLIKGLAFVIKKWKIFVVAFSSLALSAAILKLITLFTLLQATSIRAAIASTVAWIAGLLPFIILAIGIAAIILIVEDLWQAFTGGESVFRDLWLAAKRWLSKIGDEVDLVAADVADFLGFDDKAEGIRNRIRNKRNLEETQRRRREVDEGRTLRDRIERRQKQISRATAIIAADRPGTNIELLKKRIVELRKEEESLKSIARVVGEETRVSPEVTDLKIGRDIPGGLTINTLAPPRVEGPIDPRSRGQLQGNQFNANVTINTETTSSANEIGEAVRVNIRDMWDQRMREADAQAGGN